MENILNNTMDFDEFWQMYPRKVAKFVAKKSWKRLTKKEVIKVKSVLADHKLRWKDKELQYIPHASTWLNQKRFDDELEPLPKKELTSEQKDHIKMENLKKEWEEAQEDIATQEEVKAMLSAFKKNGSS
jgi:hypothetical protein